MAFKSFITAQTLLIGMMQGALHAGMSKDELHQAVEMAAGAGDQNTASRTMPTPSSPDITHLAKDIERQSDLEQAIVTAVEGLTPSDLGRITIRIPNLTMYVSEGVPQAKMAQDILRYIRSSNSGYNINSFGKFLYEMFPNTLGRGLEPHLRHAGVI